MSTATYIGLGGGRPVRHGSVTYTQAAPLAKRPVTRPVVPWVHGRRIAPPAAPTPCRPILSQQGGVILTPCRPITVAADP